ncbi:MarR family transcriptional regulator [Gordonia sp. CPCC 206044]|uniref:MarR family winged helix-turn-helix transcriptional regulator n=1 Tax=Gordonia sp. CPCC 206044 TaxID=3140793 RepID=UPI003AF35F87
MSDETDLGALATDLRVVMGQLTRQLRRQAPIGDLTRSQTSVLGRIERDGPATANDLARAEGMRPQSMAAIVASLVEAGMLSGAPDPRDGRKTILSLSERAVDEFRAGRLAREDWLAARMADVLTPAEIDGFPTTIALLRRLSGESS